MQKLFLAIETGGTKLQMVIGNEQAEILFRIRDQIDRTKGAKGILDEIAAALPSLRSKASELDGEICGIGVGFGGPVCSATGVVLSSAQIEGWKDFPIAQWLEEMTGIPTYLYNDSNAAAWGEYCKGAGKELSKLPLVCTDESIHDIGEKSKENVSQVFFYTNIGSGIGGGVVINKKLFDGQGFGAAEFGQSYMYKSRQNSFVPLEKICSGWAIENRLRSDVVPRESVLWKICHGKQEQFDCRAWGKGIEVGDEYSIKVLDEVAECFAVALCNMFCFYSPQIVAIGGGVSLIGESLIERIRECVDKYIYTNCKGRYRIVKSELDEDVVLVGTLLLTAEKNSKQMLLGMEYNAEKGGK